MIVFCVLIAILWKSVNTLLENSCILCVFYKLQNIKSCFF